MRFTLPATARHTPRRNSRRVTMAARATVFAIHQGAFSRSSHSR
jgi:hypothetical protein